jgi:hypothetical protein
MPRGTRGGARFLVLKVASWAHQWFGRSLSSPLGRGVVRSPPAQRLLWLSHRFDFCCLMVLFSVVLSFCFLLSHRLAFSSAPGVMLSPVEEYDG